MQATATPSEIVQPPAVNAFAVLRQQAHADLLASIGLAKTPAIYVPGGVLPSDHVRGRYVARQAVDEMPLFHVAAQQVADRIQAEGRVDYVVDARDLRMDGAGHLTLGSTPAPWGKPLPQEHRGLYLLLSRLSPGVFSRSFETMRRLQPAVRAAAFNDLMERLGKHLTYTTGKRMGEPKRLKLRTRRTHRVGGTQAVFAVVSDSYPTAYDGDHYVLDIAQHVQSICPDTRGTVSYDPWTTRVRFDVAWNEQDVIDYSMGDVFRLVFSGSTRDDAGARYRLWTSVLREGGALFAVDSDKAQLLARIHRGKASGVVDDIGDAVSQGMTVYAAFLADWGKLSETGIDSVVLFGKQFPTVPDALEFLVESGRVDLGHGTPEANLSALLAAWGVDAGSAPTHLVTAVATAAQGATTPAHAEATESLAAKLVQSLGAVL